MLSSSKTAPTDVKRGELLDRLADYVLANGLSAATLRPLARAAGTSDRMLLYYFPDKDAVIAAVVGRIAERMTAVLDSRRAPKPLPLGELQAQLSQIVFADDLWPYMRLWLELASRAAHGEAGLRRIGEAIGRGFLAWGEAQLDAPDRATRTRDAARLMISIEGMLVLRGIGMTDLVDLAR